MMKVWLSLLMVVSACGCERAIGSGIDAAGAGDAEMSIDAHVPEDVWVLGDARAPVIDVLVFSRTTGFRHTSIEAAQGALREIERMRGLLFEFTEDPSRFTDAELARFDVVMFLMTTGDVLDAPQQAAMERWVTSGGGFVGIHSAADTEYDWPFYGELVGAWFLSHPAIARATIHVDRTHDITETLPDPWQREDEWYDFQTNPRPDVDVLLTVDESTYAGGTMGADHPIAWAHERNGARSFYTALGHTEASWSEPAFLDHIARGIEWAAAR